MKKNVFYFIVSLIVIASCSKSNSTGGTGGNGAGGGGSTSCTGVANKFAADVNPIIQSSCATDANCHGAGSANGPGPLLTYAQISNASATIKSAISTGIMPKTGTLTTAQKNSIICWVNSGALNN